MADVRYLFDEHINTAIVDGLRRRGIDVLTANEAGLLGKPDIEYFVIALATGRVIVTYDQDFPRRHRQGQQHFGIVFCKSNTRSIRQIIDSLELIWQVFDQDGMVGRIEFI